MNDNEFLRSIARLESLNDYLETELMSLDSLFKAVGFENGIETVKSASIDFLSEIHSEIYLKELKNNNDTENNPENDDEKKDL